MNPDRDRDRLLDEALERQMAAGRETAAPDGCLDAEALGAWMDGGLDANAVLMAEAHASNCPRCQALLATVARTTPAEATAGLPAARLWRWWFAPLAATAAAVTVWMVVPPQPAPAPVNAPVQEALARPPASPAPAAAPESAAPPPGPPPSKLARRGEEPKQAAAPPPPAAAAAARATARERQASADTLQKAEAPAAPAPALQETVTAREERAAGVALFADAPVTARSSPSPNVIWAVGRAGLVQLATDGRTFARLPFPEAVDLTAVTATDDRHAIVTAADGRTFQTADGGRTWTRP